MPVQWHEGRLLTVAESERHVGFRGPEPVRLGRRIAREGVLDARVIGLAAAAGEDEHVLKRVWHLVARFGRSRG